MKLVSNYQLFYIFQKKEKKEETPTKLLDETKLITKEVARFKYKNSKYLII